MSKLAVMTKIIVIGAGVSGIAAGKDFSSYDLNDKKF